MSLLRPTAGEILDRMSIVCLKIESRRKIGVGSRQLLREYSDLADYFYSSFPIVKSGELYEELQRINAEIWKMEDSIRNTGEDTVEHLALVAKRIAYLNDERNRLIREIDKAYGCENPVEEKIYLQTRGKYDVC